MTMPMRPRARRSTLAAAGGRARLVACALALGLVGAPRGAAADPPGAGAPRVIMTRTNTELLVATARAVAGRLADQVPLPSGTRLALQPEGRDPVDTDVTEALLLALNRKGYECVLVPAAVPDTTAAGAAGAAAPDSAGAQAGAATGPGAKEAYARLQEERRAQAARADSLAALAAAQSAHPAAAAASPALPAAAVGLPLLSYRVAEGRVDYVRLFRSGIFGAERLERRATTRVTLKLHAPGSDAVRWSTSADTSFSDVIAKSDMASLEDRMRPETRPIPPQSNLKKVVEPALVVALIAGLVALFYQNRP